VAVAAAAAAVAAAVTSSTTNMEQRMLKRDADIRNVVAVASDLGRQLFDRANTFIMERERGLNDFLEHKFEHFRDEISGKLDNIVGICELNKEEVSRVILNAVYRYLSIGNNILHEHARNLNQTVTAHTQTLNQRLSELESFITQSQQTFERRFNFANVKAVQESQDYYLNTVRAQTVTLQNAIRESSALLQRQFQEKLEKTATEIREQMQAALERAESAHIIMLRERLQKMALKIGSYKEKDKDRRKKHGEEDVLRGPMAAQSSTTEERVTGTESSYKASLLSDTAIQDLTNGFKGLEVK